MLEMQRLLVQSRCLSRAAIFPRRDERKFVVIAQCFAVGCLVLDAEMAATRLFALQRVHAHQLRELDEIRDTSRSLERLIQFLAAAGYEEVLLKLRTYVRDLV